MKQQKTSSRKFAPGSFLQEAFFKEANLGKLRSGILLQKKKGLTENILQTIRGNFPNYQMLYSFLKKSYRFSLRKLHLKCFQKISSIMVYQERTPFPEYLFYRTAIKTASSKKIFLFQKRFFQITPSRKHISGSFSLTSFLQKSSIKLL